MKKIVYTVIAILLIVSCVLGVVAVEPTESFSLTDSRGLKLHSESYAIKQSDLDNNFTNYAEDEASVSLENESATYAAKSSLANVVGVVLDFNTERPVPGASIAIDGESVVVSGSDGRFQISDVVSEIYDWTVTAEGYYPAHYYNYPVDAASGASIFTFYISTDCSMEKNREDVINDNSCQEIPSEVSNEQPEQNISSYSMSGVPELGYYISVRYNNKVISKERDQYLQAVVSSETYSVSYYLDKGLTQKQAAEFYRAQAITSNSYVEYTRKVYSNHNGQGYTVCDTDHCQKYDPTLVHQAAINAVATMYYIYSEYAEAALILHTSSTGRYDYIYAGFFSSCYNQGTDTHPNQPELKAVSCSDIDKGYGHGTHAYGLCQMGAANLAKKGYSAIQIVNYYYCDCVVKFCPVF